MSKFVIDDKRLMSMWDWDRNQALGFDPSKITTGSTKKVGWKCSNGHTWLQPVSKRSASHCDCPVCLGKVLQVGMTDLATTHPELINEWHPTKNGELRPSDVSAGSNRKVWWVCPRGHEWKTEVYHRTSGRGCPYCKAELHTSFPEQAILFYLSKIIFVESRHLIAGKEADIYIPSLQTAIEYDGYFFHGKSKKKKYDSKKEETFASSGIRLLRVIDVRKAVEPYRDGNTIFVHMDQKYSKIGFVIREICDVLNLPKVEVNIAEDYQDILGQYYGLAKHGSLLERNPMLAAEWHPTKNGTLKPEFFLVSSSKSVWWLGKCGHEWQAKISNRNKGKGCPFCNQYAVDENNNLETLFPNLAAEWHPTKNGELLPNQFLPGSNKKVWWLDSNGNEWQAQISVRVRFGTGAPQLRAEKMIATRLQINLQKKGSLGMRYPALLAYWDTKANGSLDPNKCTCGSHQKVYWKCPVCGDCVMREIRWEISLFNKGTPCLKCGKKFLK